MTKINYSYKAAGCDRKHYVYIKDVLVVLGRLPKELSGKIKTIHFNDKSFGTRVLGYANVRGREISICALPPRVSLTRFLVKGQKPEDFGAVRGKQWPEIAVRRFLLYDVLLHEIGHLQLINQNAKSDKLKFAHEKLAQEFADEWRRRLWSTYFEHSDAVHNSPTMIQD